MEANIKDTLEVLFNEMENFVSTKTVVGEPIHIQDTIILPLVDVTFGVGAGASDKEKASSSGGGGLGAKVTPSAVLVIQDNNIRLVSVKSQNSLNKIIDMAPDLMSKFTTELKSKKKDDYSSGEE